MGNHNRFNLWDIETGQGPDSLELEEQETLVQLAFTPNSMALVGSTVVYPGYLTAVKMWNAAYLTIIVSSPPTARGPSCNAA